MSKDDEGWECFPPGSGVAELVEAAKHWAQCEYHTLGASPETLPIQASPFGTSLIRASRKVAGEGGR